MSNIRTYDDLLQEEQRLRQELKIYEALIRQDLAGMKENIEPVQRAYTTVNKFFTRDNRVPFFNIGLEMGIDVFLRKFLLAKAGWITKIVVPYFIKNYSSHIIGEEKRKVLMKKFQDFFAKLRPKPENPMDAATGATMYQTEPKDV
jgi:hypothetical protein